MTSERQIKANRSNANRSTGPRTISGKARSSRNAFRHGLSRPASDDLQGFERRETIALLETTLRVNSADLVSVKLDLWRIRSARCQMLDALLLDPNLERLNELRGLFRYERAAFARQKRLLKSDL
jgi:hypothetical protein